MHTGACQPFDFDGHDFSASSPRRAARIVRRVEALFALADKIEARVKSATARVEKITQAILAKAFRGELVPTEAELARQEGRDYEPAAVLLDRIRAERAPESTTTGRKSRQSQYRFHPQQKLADATSV